MKHFIKTLFISLSLLCGQVLIGQTSYCEKSGISKSDKKLIEHFWINFKRSVNTQDKTKLSSLIKFPFNCDYCILDSSKINNSAYLEVSKKMFYKNQYKIFFDTKFKKDINKYSTLVDVLMVTTNDLDGKKCNLNFGYTSIEPSKTWEGQQHFFSIAKINGKFLLTSAWTVP